MFAYCTQVLHLSEAEAYRRITVARAARRYEGLLNMLRDGRMHLTGMALILRVLKPENYRSVLARATHCSKLEIQELVAELAPRPDVRAVIRKLPQKRVSRASVGAQPPSSTSGSELFPETVEPSGMGTGMATLCDLAGEPTVPLVGPKPQTRPAATVEPLSLDTTTRLEQVGPARSEFEQWLQAGRP